MAFLDDVAVREFTQGDKDLVNAFFDGITGDAKVLFNLHDGNRKNAMRFFDGTAPNTVYFMAEYENKMIGYLFLWDIDTGVPWLGIAISEQYRSKRLGGLLLEYARNYAAEHNKGGILLTTHIANLRGQALYERSGYRYMGIDTSGKEFLYLLRL
jgi:ribosomal protein S18 acetylase RimI-like enzyme